ncbi:MAG: DUF1622 domain-containing protein [Cyanobacteria bacterium P01_F01_bin.86]
MEFLEHLESGLTHVVAVAKLLCEAIAVFCVLIGLLKALQMSLALRRQRSRQRFPFNPVRLEFGLWLALALEFQLGADILATTTAPTLETLGKLAGVAVIRTFLNYFLNKELEFELEKTGHSQDPKADWQTSAS